MEWKKEVKHKVSLFFFSFPSRALVEQHIFHEQPPTRLVSAPKQALGISGTEVETINHIRFPPLSLLLLTFPHPLIVFTSSKNARITMDRPVNLLPFSFTSSRTCSLALFDSPWSHNTSNLPPPVNHPMPKNTIPQKKKKPGEICYDQQERKKHNRGGVGGVSHPQSLFSINTATLPVDIRLQHWTKLLCDFHPGPLLLESLLVTLTR